MQFKSIASWFLVMTAVVTDTSAVVSYTSAKQKPDQARMGKPLLSRVLATLSGRSLLDGLTRTLTNMTDRPIDISRLVESYRPHMRKPQKMLGLPALEPFRMEKIPLDMNSDFAKVGGEAWNVSVRGLSGLRARRMQLRPLSSRLDFQMLFPLIVATGNYRFNGSFANTIDADGEGPFEITVKDLNATGFLSVTPEGDHLKVKDIFIEVNLTSLQVDLEGFLGGGETGKLLCAAISDAAPSLLQEQRAEVSQYISAFARDALDRKLSSVHAAAWMNAYKTMVCAATVGLVCRVPT